MWLPPRLPRTAETPPQPSRDHGVNARSGQLAGAFFTPFTRDEDAATWRRQTDLFQTDLFQPDLFQPDLFQPDLFQPTTGRDPPPAERRIARHRASRRRRALNGRGDFRCSRYRFARGRRSWRHADRLRAFRHDRSRAS
jgi:hypothetical protein